MKKKNHLSAGEILSILWPYILLVCVLIALFGVGLHISFDMIWKNTVNNIAEKFETISEDVYRNVTRTERVCDLLVTDSTVADLTQISRDQSDELENQIAFLKRQLENIRYVSSVEYTDLLVVFPDMDMVVTDGKVATGSDQAGSVIEEATHSALTLAQLKEIPANQGRSNFFREDTCVLLRSVYERNQVIAYVILCLPIRQIVPLGDLSGLVLIGNDSEYVYSNEKDITPEEYRQIREQTQQERQFEFRGQTYMAMLNVYSQFQRDILVAVPISRSALGLDSYRRTVAWMGIVCVVSLAFLFWVFYQRVLLPMKYLAEVTVQEKDRHVIRNARNSIIALKNQNEAGQREIRFLIPLGVGELMQKLCSLKPEDNGLSIAKRCMLLAGIQEDQRFCIFGLFHLEDTQNTFQEMEWKNDKVTPIFVLNNLLNDLLFTSGVVGTIAVVDRYYVVLASCDEGKDEEYFGKILNQLVEFYQKNYSVTIAATRPLFGSGTESFRQQVQNTMNGLSYLDFWYQDHVGDEEPMSSSLLPYLKSMRNLINRLGERDYPAAWNTLQQITDDLPSKPNMLQIAKYRVYSLIEVLLAAIVDQPGISGDALEELNCGSWLYKINNVQDFRTETEKLFKQIIEISHEHAPEAGGSRRMEQVQQYVTEHYFENDLTVGKIAERFGISVAHLSREYKKYRKINLIDEIQQVRVERAKELLKTQTVKEAAVASGFWDAQALVRAFKKLEGITPNEYRKMLARDDGGTDDPTG